MVIKIDEVWNRLVKYEGETFCQIRGKKFTYTIRGATLRLDTTNRSFSKGHLERALPLLPLKDTTQVRHLMAPSYMFALLTDERIVAGEW